MSTSLTNWLGVVSISMVVWSGLGFCLRVWVKKRLRKWGCDDGTLLVALIGSVAYEGLVLKAVQQGYGHRSDSLSASQTDDIERVLYVSQCFYAFSTGLSKVSNSLFILNLVRFESQCRVPITLAALSVIWTATSVLVIALRRPFTHPWTVMDGTTAMFLRWLPIESSGLLIELAQWAVWWPLFRRIQAATSKRLLVLVGFSLRLILIPLIAMRLFYLAPVNNHSPVQTTIMANIFTTAALQFSIIASTLVSIKFFLSAYDQPAPPTEGRRYKDSWEVFTYSSSTSEHCKSTVR